MLFSTFVGVVVDGVFDAETSADVLFLEALCLDPSALTAVQTSVRRRLQRVLQRLGFLTEDEAQAMADWAHGGDFSVDAEVPLEANDRRGLERLLRYCAWPAFAPERLRKINAEHLSSPAPASASADSDAEGTVGPSGGADAATAKIPASRRLGTGTERANAGRGDGAGAAGRRGASRPLGRSAGRTG